MHAYESLRLALKQGTPFLPIHDQWNARYDCVQDPLWKRIWHYRDPEYHLNYFQKVAEVVKGALFTQSPLGANTDITVKNARKFLEVFKSKYSQHTEYKACQEALLAARLGIPVQALSEEINPGFREFVSRSYLFNSLITFDHTLHFDATHKISIKHQDEYLPWESARDILTGFLSENLKISKDLLKTSPNFEKAAWESATYNYLMSNLSNLHVDGQTIKIDVDGKSYPWEEAIKLIPKQTTQKVKPHSPDLYGQSGLQNEDHYKWIIPQLLLTGDTSKWPSQFIKDPLEFDNKGKAYLWEICSSATKAHPRTFAGDHTWLRMYKFKKDPESGIIQGKMYSVGLYRPGKRSSSWQWLLDNFWLPLKVKEGYLTNDISEKWGKVWPTLAALTTKEAYQGIRRSIIDEKTREVVSFQLLSGNCDLKIKGYLSTFAKVRLPTEINAFRVVIPKPIQWIYDRTIGSRPDIEKIIIAVITPIINLISLVFGTFYVDPDLQARSKNTIKPLISSWRDIFDSSKTTLHSPWLLATRIRTHVEKWRKEQPGREFKLPPEYQVTPQVSV